MHISEGGSRVGSAHHMTVLVLDGGASLDDACLVCAATLGVLHREAQPEIVLTPAPGVCCGRCPDCTGVWPVQCASGPHHGDH